MQRVKRRRPDAGGVSGLLKAAVSALGVAVGVGLLLLVRSPPTAEWTSPAATTTTTLPVPTSTTTTTTTSTTVPPYDGWVDPASSGQPWGDVPGLLTFRGNPTRTYYGRGPVPSGEPDTAWRFPEDGPMCSLSTVGDETSRWCGSGWTGQPAVFERDGLTWVVVGAYSRNVHFLDADTGERLLPDFETGDIIKGSVTVDPDGYPLVYIGSRDDKYRVISFDTGVPTELWALNARDVSPVRWNDDWDGAGLVLDDYLIVGGENSHLHIVKLNRGYEIDGLVTVSPELVFNAPGWDDQLLRDADGNVSIENSVAVSGDVVYFANSGGLVQGWDIGGLADGEQPERVFRFWTGDDTDATLVIDAAGMIYAAVEYERGTARSREVGQILKLDPAREDPLVWGVDARDASGQSGVWATPGLHRDLLIVPTHSGQALGIDTDTGDVRWTVRLSGAAWSSPVIVDDVWIQGDCGGRLTAFDVSDTTVEPPQLWQIDLGGCIESTPAVWEGLITVGTRTGWIYGIR